jgi:hypothetical protein
MLHIRVSNQERDESNSSPRAAYTAAARDCPVPDARGANTAPVRVWHAPSTAGRGGHFGTAVVLDDSR